MEFMRLSCTPSQSIPLGGNSWSYFIMGGAVWQCGGKLTVTLFVSFDVLLDDKIEFEVTKKVRPNYKERTCKYVSLIVVTQFLITVKGSRKERNIFCQDIVSP